MFFFLKKLKDHNSTLFQANGTHVKRGAKNPHNFNVKHITRIEEKQLQASQEIETLKEKKRTFEQIFKGAQGKSVSKKRKQKENRWKSNDSKQNRFENSTHVSNLHCKSPQKGASLLSYLPPFPDSP